MKHTTNQTIPDVVGIDCCTSFGMHAPPEAIADDAAQTSWRRS